MDRGGSRGNRGDAVRCDGAQAAGAIPGHQFSEDFLWTEWSTVVDAWQLGTWNEYRDVKRLGRRTRLPESRRKMLWTSFEASRRTLVADKLTTEAEVFGRLAKRMESLARPTFDFVIVDESQDVSVSELRFLAALGGNRPNGLFFAGDLGQRIFQQPFSWSSLGIDVRGRASRLRSNYRTSHQI